MHVNWADILNLAFQVVITYYVNRNHQTIKETHYCIDRAKESEDFHTDVIVQMLSDIKDSIKR